jgi:F-type H+-transporting ATPase subunit alpha
MSGAEQVTENHGSRAILIVADKSQQKSIDAIIAGFSQKLGFLPDFDVVEDEKITGGFIAIVDGHVYDASFSSRLHDLSKALTDSLEHAETESSFATVGAFLKERASHASAAPKIYNYGEVVSAADGIVHIRGLSGSKYGELVEFDGGAVGIILDLSVSGAGAALIDGEVTTKSVVHPTGRVAEIPVGESLLGRIVDPLGRPLDGYELHTKRTRPSEATAPTIRERDAVNTPLETGILAIDSMIPIGRGQRELIIGDRQTGKTSIALSAIINQKSTGVTCVYCAIGQKASSVAESAERLRRAGALEHTVIVSASGSDSAAMQYLAPYAATAVAEEFMYAGRDVLIVYDDLSKHAQAYRTLSLLLRRPSGREAYPGDVFYLHSRLLERSAKLSRELGGGSITALPIIETMAGDISAYIPTNVISITDGQIYLEAELFSSGQRPAVNVGLSVSRVGRAAQYKSMRAVSGSLRLEVAQYRDMAVFAQFGADIDAETDKQLRSGERLMELLKQSDYRQYSSAEQVALLVAAKLGIFANYKPGEINSAAQRALLYLSQHSDFIMHSIKNSGELTDFDRTDLERALHAFAAADNHDGDSK